MNYNSSKNQDIKAKFVNREVLYCVSSLIYNLSDKFMDDDDYLHLIESKDYESPARDDGWIPVDEAISFSLYRMESENGIVPDSIMFIQMNDGKAVDYSESDDFEGLCYDKDIEPQYDDVYEHWIVTDYLAKKLEEHGQITADFLGLTIWGRCCTGQAILLDYVISLICEELEILEGQPYEWKV